MEQKALRLGEALTQEGAWEADGVTVLTASLALPQLSGASRRAARFNRYYRHFCRAYLAYCREVLLPDAAASCRAAMAVSAPWSAARAELGWRVSLYSGGLLSVVCEAREVVDGLAPYQIRRAEVWDLSMGLPVPLDEFFPPRTRCKKALVRFAREEAQRRAEAGAAYRENWRAMLRRALNTRDFFLTPEGLCFFYPLCALGGAREGIVTFTMPYDASAGPFPPGR